jgi:hypothetical protein
MSASVLVVVTLLRTSEISTVAGLSGLSPHKGGISAPLLYIPRVIPGIRGGTSGVLLLSNQFRVGADILYGYNQSRHLFS